MLFEFRCLNCDETLRAETRFIGRMSRCPRCQNRLVVPSLDAAHVLRVIHEEPASGPEELGPAESEPSEVIFLSEDLIEPADVRRAIRALFQRHVIDVVRTIPLWGISIALHAVVILLLATLGIFTLSGARVARRITIPPPKSWVALVELPKQMQDLKLERDVTPDFQDVLQHTEPSDGARGSAGEDFLGMGGSGESRATIAIEDPLGKIVAAGTGRGVGPLGPEGSGGSVNYHGFQVSGARSVVFIVDASGSMLTGEPGKTRWDEAVKELRNSIAKLSFGHLFNVYFARVLPGQSTFYERWKDELVLSNPANKEDCYRFIDRMDAEMRGIGEAAARGNFAYGAGTDVTQATADALRFSPEVIFILSDAEFQELLRTGHNPADEIRRLNRTRGARIYTICFKERSGERIMKRIADENRGRYKFVP